MSDRMLEVLSSLILILVVFTIFLVLIDGLKPVLDFAKGVWDAILWVGGTGTSILGLRIKTYLGSRDNPW